MVASSAGAVLQSLAETFADAMEAMKTSLNAAEGVEMDDDGAAVDVCDWVAQTPGTGTGNLLINAFERFHARRLDSVSGEFVTEEFIMSNRQRVRFSGRLCQLSVRA